MKRNLFLVGGLLIVILIVASVFGWQRVTANAAASNTREQTATVTRGSLVASVNTSGNVSALSSAMLSFSSSGRVTQVAVQVGDQVRQGQTLMRLDSTDAQLALRTVQTTLASAQANLDAAQAKNAMNSQQLIVAKTPLDKATIALQKAQSDYNAVAWRNDVGMTPQAVALQQATLDYESAELNYQIATAGINDTALRQAEASFDMAQIAVQQAQRNLDKLTLYAPFDGIVVAVNYSVGDSIGTGTAVELSDAAHLQVKAMVSEVDIAKVRVGETTMISLDALPSAMLHGTITTISPVGMVTMGVVDYPVTVAITNTDSRIKSGMTANLAVTVDRRDNILLVPIRAIRAQGAQKVAVVEYKDQTVQAPVSIGLSNDTQVEITSGLQEGTVVVLNQSQTNASNGGVGHLLMGATMGH